MRRASKIDANHAAIVEAYRDLGCMVLSLAALGKGVPDLLVQRRGQFALVEVKTAKGKLEPAQEAFRQQWPVRVVRSVEDVFQHVQAMRAA